MTARMAERMVEATVSVRAATGAVSAVVVVLPGGKAESYAPTASQQLTRLRMVPFARAIARHGRQHGVEVWTVHYRVRGWNGPDASPVPDVRWALAEVRRRHGDVPVVLVGHSMGGRAALRVAGAPCVVGVVALAPWLPDSEQVERLGDRRVLIVHGRADLVTSPRASRRYARRLDGVARCVGYLRVCGEMHAMVFRPRVWHRVTVSYVLNVLGLAPLPGRWRRALVRGYV